MSERPTSSDEPQPSEPAFTLLSLQRVDATPRSTLICISAELAGAGEDANPILYLSPLAKVLRPAWSSWEGDEWSAEFAVATTLIDGDGVQLSVLLQDHPLIGLPAPERDLPAAEREAPPESDDAPEPKRPSKRRTSRLKGLATVAILSVAAWGGSSALQGSAPPASRADSAVPPAIDVDGLDGPSADSRAPGDAKRAPEQASKPTPEQAVAATPPGMRLVAHATARRVALYRSPTATRTRRFVHHPNSVGAPAVFLVRSASGTRYKVALPIRPNGSTAWIRAADVRVKLVDHRIDVDLTRHELTVWRGGRRLQRSAIGVGKSLTPTPSGTYYVTALIKPHDPGGVYGPYAFAISAHSTVLDEFAGGNGRIGIHGTNRPSGIGDDVSHGCIRLPNKVIRRLAKLLPLGTPVRISR